MTFKIQCVQQSALLNECSPGNSGEPAMGHQALYSFDPHNCHVRQSLILLISRLRRSKLSADTVSEFILHLPTSLPALPPLLCKRDHCPSFRSSLRAFALAAPSTRTLRCPWVLAWLALSYCLGLCLNITI